MAEQLTGTAPVISWAQPIALWLVAAVIGVTAWQTHRAVQVRRERLEPHQAVNRLVLGRAGALVGALVAAGTPATRSAGSAIPPSWPVSASCGAPWRSSRAS